MYSLAGRRAVACSYATDAEAVAILKRNSTNATTINVPIGSTLYLLKDAVGGTTTPATSGEVWRQGHVSLRHAVDAELGLDGLNAYGKKVALTVVPRIHTADAAGAPTTTTRAACAASLRLNLANLVDESFYRKVLNELSGAASFEVNGECVFVVSVVCLMF